MTKARCSRTGITGTGPSGRAVKVNYATHDIWLRNPTKTSNIRRITHISQAVQLVRDNNNKPVEMLVVPKHTISHTAPRFNTIPVAKWGFPMSFPAKPRSLQRKAILPTQASLLAEALTDADRVRDMRYVQAWAFQMYGPKDNRAKEVGKGYDTTKLHSRPEMHPQGGVTQPRKLTPEELEDLKAVPERVLARRALYNKQLSEAEMVTLAKSPEAPIRRIVFECEHPLPGAVTEVLLQTALQDWSYTHLLGTHELTEAAYVHFSSPYAAWSNRELIAARGDLPEQFQNTLVEDPNETVVGALLNNPNLTESVRLRAVAQHKVLFDERFELGISQADAWEWSQLAGDPRLSAEQQLRLLKRAGSNQDILVKVARRDDLSPEARSVIWGTKARTAIARRADASRAEIDRLVKDGTKMCGEAVAGRPGLTKAQVDVLIDSRFDDVVVRAASTQTLTSGQVNRVLDRESITGQFLRKMKLTREGLTDLEQSGTMDRLRDMDLLRVLQENPSAPSDIVGPTTAGVDPILGRLVSHPAELSVGQMQRALELAGTWKGSITELAETVSTTFAPRLEVVDTGRSAVSQND